MVSRQVIRSIAFFGFLFLLMVAAEFLFFSEPEVPEISYSRFLDSLYNYRIERVEISGDKIFGVMRPAGNKPNQPNQSNQTNPPDGYTPLPFGSKHTPWRLDLRSLATELNPPETPQIDGNQSVSNEQLVFTVRALGNPDLIGLLRKYNVGFSARIEYFWSRDFLLNWIIPFGLLAILWIIISGQRLRAPADVLQIGKNKVRIYRENLKTPIRFAELGGIDEAIERTREIVAFLKAPERFTQLGARLPNGVLLVGPPGVGKAHLAKALAGESGVPFFSFNGFELVELFARPGGPEIRDLFKAVQLKAPCILFIDKLDTIVQARIGQGVQNLRSYGLENIINQLLSEMDRLNGRAGIIVIAAMNRSEIVEPDWSRPGRFNRRIVIDRPRREGREQLFRIHCKKLVLADDIDFSNLAAESIGMVGADIANLCNEAALLATRCNREKITRADFQEALQKAITELGRKGLYLNEKNRKTRAFHEAGHALVAHFTPGIDPLRKVSIVPQDFDPRGERLPPSTEDRLLLSKTELMGKILTLLAGRAAEEVVFGEISTGAADDLEQSDRLIRAMLGIYGMSNRLPNQSLPRQGSPGYPGPSERGAGYSAQTERILEQEHLQILESAYLEAKTLIQQHRAELEAIAKRLLEKERIGAKDLNELLGPRPKSHVATDKNRNKDIH